MKLDTGKFCIGSFELQEGWTAKDLSEGILSLADEDAMRSEEEGGPVLKNFKNFYLKIYGPYDHKIVSHVRKCEYCPNNPEFYRFMDYNELIDEKQEVLVLKSNYFNFKEYKVVCSYYSDKKLMKNMNDTYIELRADKKSVWDKLFESILRLIKRMTSF